MACMGQYIGTDVKTTIYTEDTESPYIKRDSFFYRRINSISNDKQTTNIVHRDAVAYIVRCYTGR